MSVEIYYRDPQHMGEIVGPLTRAQAERGIAAGDIERHFETSFDRNEWRQAGDAFPEMFDAAARNRTGASPWSRIRPLAERIGLLVRRAALVTWHYLRTVGSYYWSNRVALWKLFTEYATWFQPTGVRTEIRVTTSSKLAAAIYDGEQWEIELPDCCAICGKDTDCDWNTEQRSVPNLVWPLWGPLGGLILGLFFGLFSLFGLVYWNRWFIPPFVVFGMALGYHQRDETLIKVRYRRCRKHLNSTSLPSFRSIADGLVIGVGNRTVWRQFHYGKTALDMPAPVPSDDTDRRPAAWKESGSAESKPKDVPTIPLAGGDADHDFDPEVDLEVDFPDLDYSESDEPDYLESDEPGQVPRESD